MLGEAGRNGRLIAFAGQLARVALLLLMLALSMLLPCYGLNQAIVKEWHHQKELIYHPSGLAVKSEKSIWVANDVVEGSLGNLDPSTDPSTYTWWTFKDWGNLFDIDIGSDGKVWITSPQNKRIARFDPVSGTCEYVSLEAAPYKILYVSDDEVWFSATDASQIGRLTSKSVDMYPVCEGCEPYDLGKDSDGNIWFTEKAANEKGRRLGVLEVGKEPQVLHLALPKNAIGESIPYGLHIVHEKQLHYDNIWFTDTSKNTINLLTFYKEGLYQLREWMIPTSRSNPFSLYSSDGLIWFTEAPGGLLTIGKFDQSAAPSATTDIKSGAGGVKPSSEEAEFEKTEAKMSSDKVEPTLDETSVSASGGFTEWSLKRDGSNLVDINEGSIWFIDEGRNTIGRLDPAPAPPAPASPVGGYLSPVNKPVILVPYLALFAVVTAAAVAVAAPWKKRDS